MDLKRPSQEFFFFFESTNYSYRLAFYVRLVYTSTSRNWPYLTCLHSSSFGHWGIVFVGHFTASSWVRSDGWGLHLSSLWWYHFSLMSFTSRCLKSRPHFERGFPEKWHFAILYFLAPSESGPISHCPLCLQSSTH